MTQWLKIAGAALAAVLIGLENAYPHAAWMPAVISGIAAVVGGLHLAPPIPAKAAPHGSPSQ